MSPPLPPTLLAINNDGDDDVVVRVAKDANGVGHHPWQTCGERIAHTHTGRRTSIVVVGSHFFVMRGAVDKWNFVIAEFALFNKTVPSVVGLESIGNESVSVNQSINAISDSHSTLRESYQVWYGSEGRACAEFFGTKVTHKHMFHARNQK